MNDLLALMVRYENSLKTSPLIVDCGVGDEATEYVASVESRQPKSEHCFGRDRACNLEPHAPLADFSGTQSTATVSFCSATETSAQRMFRILDSIAEPDFANCYGDAEDGRQRGDMFVKYQPRKIASKPSYRRYSAPLKDIRDYLSPPDSGNGLQSTVVANRSEEGALNEKARSVAQPPHLASRTPATEEKRSECKALEFDLNSKQCSFLDHSTRDRISRGVRPPGGRRSLGSALPSGREKEDFKIDRRRSSVFCSRKKIRDELRSDKESKKDSSNNNSENTIVLRLRTLRQNLKRIFRLKAT